METPAAAPIAHKGFFRRLLSWRGILFLVAALFTFAVLLVAEENWRGNRAWQNYKREMEAKGESLDPSTLIPPKVPDDENFCMTPLFAPIFTLPPGDLRLPMKLVTNVVHGEHGETHVSEAGANRGTNVALPMFDLNVDYPAQPLGWSGGMAADLLVLATAIQRSKSKSSSPEITDVRQAANIILDEMMPFDSILKELESDAIRPYSRFNIIYDKWERPENYQISIEHFVLSKWLFYDLNLHAKAQIEAGHPDQALGDINVMFRIDDGLKEEPIRMSQLVRMACITILLQPVGQGLAEHRWSDAQLQILQARLQKVDILSSFDRALHGERLIIANSRFDRGTLNPEGLEITPRGWSRMEEVSLDRAMDEFIFPRINLAAREINPTVNYNIDAAFEKFAANHGFRTTFIDHNIFAKMTLRIYGPAVRKVAFAQNQVDFARILCALERYRLVEAQYPESLDALTPRFMAALPHDIINGEPLKYRRTDDGRFVLYSIGWNEKDDGGVVIKGKDGRQDTTQGDWVFQYPQTN